MEKSLRAVLEEQEDKEKTITIKDMRFQKILTDKICNILKMEDNEILDYEKIMIGVDDNMEINSFVVRKPENI